MKSGVVLALLVAVPGVFLGLVIGWATATSPEDLGSAVLEASDYRGKTTAELNGILNKFAEQRTLDMKQFEARIAAMEAKLKTDSKGGE